MTVFAHLGAGLEQWTVGPAPLLLVLVGLYALGAMRAGRASEWRTGSFLLGVAMLATALLSPLHVLSGRSLSAHMAQHTLLLLAPLPLMAARTGTRTLQALPPRVRGSVARRLRRHHGSLTSHRVAAPLAIFVIVFWHLPPVFEPASTVEWLHAIEHLALLVAGGIYWFTVLGFGARRERLYGASLASVAGLALVGGAVGGLMTFSRVPWYPDYASRAAAEGIDWLVDQQLAGVTMWLPMGVVLMGAAAWLAHRWQAEALRLPDPTVDPAAPFSPAAALARHPNSPPRPGLAGPRAGYSKGERRKH